MVKSFVGLLARGADIIAQGAPEARQRAYARHAELYEALLRRDPEQARRAMRQHLEEVRHGLLEGFSESSPQTHSTTEGSA